MPEPIAVAVAGAAGRMGATVCDAVESAEGLELAGRADPALGTEIGDLLGDADVVVDFTVPDQALPNAHACLHAGVSVVIGTTGFDLDKLRRCAEDHWNGGEGARAFVAPNFAIGAVLMMELGRRAAEFMPEVEIIELHHDRKLDAPSGTAARTADLLTAAGAHVHEPIHSVRLPGLVAHQELIFGGEGETLTIRHDSIDRSSFMPGVVLACRRVGSLPDPLTVGLEAIL
ncbi:MAG: 4-hydroxy-tetrahydrodipicolinate reductase [Solirubrobacterales bacterium]|nr:4-hydroxy-tetrahydrodipicolinate reductase [Solirubrobacterales bacterium]